MTFSTRDCIHSTDQTERSISDETLDGYPIYRHFKHILYAPFDTPQRVAVIAAACRAVEAYGLTLAQPTAIFLEILRRCREMLSVLGPLIPSKDDLESNPLYRRLQRHPAWALCYRLAATAPERHGRDFAAAGVEIALGLVTTKPFRKGYADALRRPLTPERIHIDAPVDWEKAYVKTRVQAAEFFEFDPSSEGLGNTPRLFDLAAGLQLTRKALYASPRRRQAVLHRETQSADTFVRSAIRIGDLVRRGDDPGMQTMLGSLSGISVELTSEIPLVEPPSSTGWTMWFDVRNGVLLTCLDAMARGAARGGGSMFRSTTKVLAKPVPQILATELQARSQRHPDATTIGQLIRMTGTNGRSLTLPDAPSTIRPTVARFLSTTAPYLVQRGMDRLTAAVLANDYSVVPLSKLYYTMVDPADIWAAAAFAFDAMGWGEPVKPIVTHAAGSKVVPTRGAIVAMYQFMAETVASSYPGRNASDLRLFAHHCLYARVTASIAVHCLAAREHRVLRFNTLNLPERASLCCYADKRVGPAPGAHPVAVCTLLRRQVGHWYAHCRALLARLERRIDKRNTAIVAYLRRVVNGDPCPLFFEIADGRTRSIRAIGTSDLVKWWPDECRFDGDFGRHFWECELHVQGISSSTVDWFMRHVIDGVAPSTSVSAKTIDEMTDAVCRAQDGLFNELGIGPIAGLAKK